jgi:hypothetical protein
VKGPRHRAEIRSVPGAALCSICVCGTELTGPSTKEVVGRLMGGTRSQRQQNQPTRCPLYPQKRTFVSAIGMSALCQKRTSSKTFNRFAETMAKLFYSATPQAMRAPPPPSGAGWSE